MQDLIKSLTTEIKEMESSLKQLFRDLEVMGVQDTALSQRIQDLEKQAKKQVMDPTRLKKLEKQVSTFEKEYQDAAEAVGKIQEQVNK